MPADSSMRLVAEMDHNIAAAASCGMHKIAIAAVNQTMVEAIYISLLKNRNLHSAADSDSFTGNWWNRDLETTHH